MSAGDVTPPPDGILVVDDNRAKRVALRTLLEPLGHSIVEVDSGVEALRRVFDRDFAVILLDVRMPIMDGFETAALIRTRGRSESTPIIFVTAYSADEFSSYDRGAFGVFDFISAPLSADEIRAKVSAFANLALRSADLAAQAVELEQSLVVLQVANGRLSHLAGEDSLTGLGNRRALDQKLDCLDARAARYGHRYCVAVLEIDDFTAYHQHYGSVAGDALLATVAAYLQERLRGGDELYRLNDRELLCVFPEQSAPDASQATRRMQLGVVALNLPHAGSPVGIVTMSAGLAVQDGDGLESAHDVIGAAESRLPHLVMPGN